MTFKILSLDGGGIRGVLSARILQEVEGQLKAQNKSLYEYFDMITGTSTGSILTAAIATRKPTAEIIELYRTKGESIFTPRQKIQNISNFTKFLPGGLQGIIAALYKAKYPHAGIERALKSALGEIKLKEVEKPIILILAYDTLYRNTTFFTNCHPDKGDRWYDDLPLWKICVSSSSAPTFFPPYELEPVDKEKFGKDWKFPHIDGGVGANNPSLAALSHVIKLARAKNVSPAIKQKYNLANLELDDVAILSIGTGQTGEPIEYETVREWRQLSWAQNITNMFMEPTSEITSTVCAQLMGGLDSERYLRLQFDLNERFQPKPNESYLDVRKLLPSEERVNKFTGYKVSEAMDNPATVEELIRTADAFLEKGLSYETRNERGIPVKQAIANFLKNN
jgi:patatin-like phospholipase/acyl hydrolase